ncbi:partner of Y14 and mago isoform X1 [Ricinus communis]|uniref:partner of Y14 and mago isoform X1 n=1 Tax=Ricinus communis TaxID=3988 RepID=UPI000772D209|nr:partner of Y14 and mago isoform X1 [Ricinus communis]|eukprot:XP_015580502.1 partner of Y14 and mago isoform X1 [Ricinus communis]
MATNNNGGGGREEEQIKKMAELSKTLKEGERILAPTRRPDGTLRKPIRIRAGYVPQDEVAIYQSRGALWKKEMQSLHVVPPGYDPGMDAKPKTKSVKRNERKKEKRLQQAALEKGKNLDASAAGDMKREVLPDEDVGHASESVKSLTSQMNELDVSANPVLSIPGDSTETLDPNASSQDIDKRIRALKKKIRQAEAQQQKATSQDMKPEQLEKLAKLEGWHQELKILEGKKSEQAAS